MGKLTRRKLIAQMSVPPIVASFGGTLLGNAKPSSEPTSVPDEKLAGARTFNVRDFGAKGDGHTLDTRAVQLAIDAAHQDRGGTVLIPAGIFVVGTIELKSNVTLYLAAQGRLLGTERPDQYKAGNGIPPNNGNIVMLSAANAENITIQGPGTIDGNGGKFFTGKGDMTGPGQNSAQGYSQRPHLMVFYRCKNLSIHDVFLTASAYHCCRILECRQVKLEGIRIYNRVNLNNDGFHLNSSQYVHIVNCDVVCQDDACALFGSSKFITVTNCTFSTRWSIFRFGGGEAENITVSNCVIYDTYGCPIKMRCGAQSRFENISFSNLVMQNVTGPITVGLDSSRRNPNLDPAASNKQAKGVVRNISFNSIRGFVVAEGRQHDDLPWPQKFRPGETRQCIVVNGVGDDIIENVSFNDIHFTFEGGGTADEAAAEVPKIAGEYFEIGTPPAYGLYGRNVRGLTVSNVRFELTKGDQRPAIDLENVSDVSVNGLSAHGDSNGRSLIRIKNTRDALFAAVRILTTTPAFMELIGVNNSSITIDGGDLTKAASPLVTSGGASSNVVRLRV